MPSHLLLLELGNRSYGFLVSGRCRYSGVLRKPLGWAMRRLVPLVRTRVAFVHTTNSLYRTVLAAQRVYSGITTHVTSG
jgi:hypothetical protein